MWRALLFTSLAACFGEGPTPGTPSGVTMLAYTNLPGDSQACTDSRYFSSVAIGANGGFAVSLPYQPFTQNCGNNGMQMPGDANIISFARDGSGSSIQTTIPSTSGAQVTPLVAGTGAFASFTNNQLVVGPSGTTFSGAMTSLQAGGFFDDGGTWFVAGWQPQTGPADIASPDFPQNGGALGTNGPPTFIQLPYDGSGRIMPISPPDQFLCDELKNCLAGTPDNLYYLTRTPTTATLWAYPRSGTAPTDAKAAAMFDLSGGRTPVGLVADAAHVFVTIANDWRNASTPVSCEIDAYDITAGTTAKLVQTTNFSCLDAAVSLAGDAVYFAIVKTTIDDNNTFMKGIGVGRAGLDGTVETLALDISGVDRGPRRVLADVRFVYLVDPIAIAKIDETALDGAQDFSP